MNLEKCNSLIEPDGICHCPKEEIEWFKGFKKSKKKNEIDECIDIRTGRCLRCNGARLGKSGKVLKDTDLLIRDIDRKNLKILSYLKGDTIK